MTTYGTPERLKQALIIAYGQKAKTII